MRAVDFITEDEVKPYQSTDLNITRAVELLNAHCSDAVALVNNPIWRGMKNHNAEIISADPSTGVRRSQNTSNYYTELIDNSPYFKGWPKRSQSFVCSTSSNRANDYTGHYEVEGALYAIFPYNGVKVAVCPFDDIWETQVSLPEFGQRFYSLEDFNRWIQNELELPDDYAGMVKKIGSPAFEYQQYQINKGLELAEKPRISANDVIPALQRALSPERTGFRLMSIPEFAAARKINELNDREVWIAGPVIAIQFGLFQKFKSAFQQRGQQ